MLTENLQLKHILKKGRIEDKMLQVDLEKNLS